MAGRPLIRARREAAGLPPLGRGNGMGWGGPAKGRGQRGNEGRGGGRPKKEVAEARAAARSERTEALEGILWDLAFNAEQEMLRLHAACALIERWEGKPVKRVAAEVQPRPFAHLSDAELESLLAETAAAAEAAACPDRDEG